MSTLIGHSFGGNFLSRYLSTRLAEILPRRFKRLMYVGSAMGMVLRNRTPDTRIVSRVNNKLRLAYCATNLLFPIYIGAIIWKSLQDNIIRLQNGCVALCSIELNALCDMDCWRTGVLFARNTPIWLQYGSEELMTADVHDMLVQLKAA